jgi:hypothetical protein
LCPARCGAITGSGDPRSEIHLNAGHNRDRLAALLARAKAPLRNGFDRLLVQTRIERLGDWYRLRPAILVHYQGQKDGALNLREDAVYSPPLNI